MWGHWLFLIVGYVIGTAVAHVALTYPPARKYDLDFLDNGRTKAPCGMPKGDTATSLPAASGAMINVTWHLAYPHRGGFKLELLDQNDRYLMDLTPTNANTDYVGSEDTTAQSYTVSFPESVTCKGCTLRLLRQAQEWGHQYLFWSCADVDIVPVTELTTVCSGHGKTNANGQCQCDHLYSGVVCQYKDECWDDVDCGSHGRCINIDATTFPKRQCYCEIGWFGERCSKESPVRDVNIDTSKYTTQELSDEFTLLWRIIPELDEIEVVMRIKGTNYAAVGWRPHGITQSCKSFPIVQNKIFLKELEPSPRHAVSDSSKLNVLKVQSEPSPKSEPKAEPKGVSKAEPEPEPNAEPESEPEPNSEHKQKIEQPGFENNSKLEGKVKSKAEPEPKAEGNVEPEPKAMGNAEPEPKAEGNAEPEPKAEGNAEPEPKVEGNAEPEPKAEGNAEPEPKAEGNAEPEPKAEGNAEPEPKAEGNAEPEPKAKGNAEPEPKAEGNAEPEPKVEGNAEPEPDVRGKSEPEPKPEGKAEPEPSASKAEPEPKAISEPESQSNYNTEIPIKLNIDSLKSSTHIVAEPDTTAEPPSKTVSVQVTHSLHNVRSRRQITIRTSDFILKDPVPVPPTPEPLPETSAEPTSVPEPPKFKKHFTSAEPHLPAKVHIIKSLNNPELTKTEPEPENNPEAEAKSPSIKGNKNITTDHNYPERTPFTPRADFHAMDCTDIVIGMARGSLSRIKDFYTRDRSTPRVDSYFGGKDDITAALGFEVDGITTILFRKPMKATDLTDHAITDNLMDVIWARGQEPNMYVHSPTTGLEAGKAKIADFYRPDELKYHGHGNQRGKLTLNFFEKKKTRTVEQLDCQGEWKYPANCQGKQCEYSIKWKFLDTTDEVSFVVTSIHTDRWTGIGFSKDRRMPMTDAIIGWVDHIDRATILDVWMNNYAPPKLDKSQDIYNISGERKDGVTTLHFVRKRFTIDFDNDVHFSDTECSYLMFPVKGGTFNAISKKIGKHEMTPVVSSEKVCIRKCQIGGLKKEVISEPEPKSEPEPDKGVKIVPEPTVEPEPKSEPVPTTISEPEPKSVSGRNFVSSCLGEWKSPPNCEGHGCEYKANWFYVDETDEIIFTISSRSYNKWTGIGFSKNRAMTETDAVIGWIEETGRSFIMDTWLESYSPPILDAIQNIHNASGQRVDGMTVLQFVRKRGTNDAEKDLQFKNECLYFIYPVRGGVFNAVNKKIRKHESTPVVSNKKICIHSCRSKVVPTTITTQPTTERIQTSTYSESFSTKYQVTVDSSSVKTSLSTTTTQSTVSFSSSKYSIEVKLRQTEKNELQNEKSQRYQILQKQLLQEMNTALQNVGLQALEFAGFKSDETEQDVIARMHVTLSRQIPLKEGRNLHTDKTNSKSADLHSILNSTVNTGRLGSLPVDPAYLNIISLSAVQDKSPHENPIEQESSSSGLTDEQVKIYIIISGVLALVFLVIVQAACMIYRDRRAKRGSHTKEKLLNNSHWKDYSVTASSNYSYENFAMQDDENKISKHPIGSVSNGSGLSKGSAASQPTNGLGLPRVGPPDRMLPRNAGYSATFERMAMRRNNNGPNNTSVPPSYATHDRSMRSMSGGAHGQHELRPDFYFMPHQRRYSGEVVRVFVDYNNPEYTGK